jgi:hypothetical protein
MKFLLIYGPPAVGKLTVAEEVSRLTGMRVLDNHATVNAVQPVFDFDTDSYRHVLRTVRLAIIEEAARQDVSIVSTFVYLPISTPYIDLLSEVLTRCGCMLSLLRLTADREVLRSRVLGENRPGRQKISTVAELEAYLDSHAVDHAIPERFSLIIDNSTLSATETAERAIRHFGLAPVAQ